MSAGVSSSEQRARVHAGQFEPVDPLHPGAILLAAAIGGLGPVATVRGWGPVTLAHEHRSAALLAATATAIVVAAWLGRASRALALVSLPVLVVAGAAATWSTAGRLQGAWCVLATAAALATVEVVHRPERSPTRSMIGTITLVGIAAAGVTWARTGPGLLAATVLVSSVAIGVPLASDPRLAAVVDPRLRAAARATRSTARRSGQALLRTARSITSSGTAAATHGGRAAHGVVRRTTPRVTEWRQRNGAAALAGSVTAAAMLPVFLPLVSDFSRTAIGFTDYQTHMSAAETTTLVPFTTMTPHWLFQFLTAVVRPFTGLHLGSAMVLAGSCGLTVFVLSRLAERPGAASGGPSPAVAATIGSLAFWLDSPTAFLNATGLLDPPRVFAPLHAWGSPTDTMALPLLLLLLIAVERFLDEDATPWNRPTSVRIALVAAVTLTLLTKPNVPMIMLAVVPVALLLRHGRCTARLAAGAVWFALPTVAVLALQFRHMRVSRAIAELDPGGWGVTIEPLAFLDLWDADKGGPWFWISAAVIISLGAWVIGRRYWQEPILVLAHLTMLFSLLPMVLLRETGLRADDGNFMKGAFGATMVLTTLTIVEVGRQVVLSRSAHGPGWSSGQRRRRLAVCAVVGSSYLLGAAAVYLTTVAPGLLPGQIWPVN